MNLRRKRRIIHRTTQDRQAHHKESIQNPTEGSKAGGGTAGRRRSLSTLLILVLLIAGLAILLYPTVSDWYNRQHETRAIANYNQTVASNTDEENEQMWDEAVAYNAARALTGNDFSLSQKDDNDPAKQAYLNTLDVTGTGIMGYIRIDQVDINLPIYHDTTDAVLQTAVGHLAGTSLPVGGESSHCVLTGHTGLPSARLFTDIDQLEVGDTFQIIVLDHTLTYEVESIQTVLPEELSRLEIEEGRDLVTLVTCTPYGINTHRLLVTGHRIANPKETKKPSADWRQQLMEVLLKEILPILIAAAAIITIVILAIKRNNKRKRSKVQQKD